MASGTCTPRSRGFATTLTAAESSIFRLYQLLSNPSDTIGLLLHQDVNMYTTAGLSTMWSRSVSEWNGIGPHAGMQATLFRSHAREEMAAAETALAQVTATFQQGFSGNAQILGLLQRAVEAHEAGLRQYDNRDYLAVMDSAMQALSLTSQSLTLMGRAGQVYDPLRINPLPADSSLHPAIDSAELERALQSITREQYQRGLLLLGAH